jgi:MFS family permease
MPTPEVEAESARRGAPIQRLPAIHRIAPRVYYGWIVMAGSFVLSFVSVGIGFYGQTVFLDALIRENGWSQETVSGASTLYFTVSGLAGIAVGRVVDRWGARGSLFAGSLLMAAALLWLGRIERPTELYAVYAVLAVSFAMTAAVPLNAVLARWFVARRAFAMSLSQTGVSLGGIVLVPAMTLLIAGRGLEVATWALAATVLALMLPIITWVIRWDPADHGLAADGEPAATAIGVESRVWRARDAIRTSSFVTLSLSFSLILFCQTGLSVHVLHMLREHMSAGAAAMGVSLVPFGSIVGRLFVGRIADRVDMRLLAAGLFGTQALAHLGLGLASGPAAMMFFTFVFGLTIGSVFMLQSLLVMELFGVRSFGTVFGLVNLVTSIAGGLGPLAVGSVAANLGGYPSAVHMLSAAAALGAVTVLRVPAPPGRPGDTKSKARGSATHSSSAASPPR